MELTPEARLDRLERIARLFVKAGLRQRRESRDQAGKIDHLIDHQIINEERFADQSGRIDDLIGLQVRNEERFADHNGRISNLIKFQKDNEVRFSKLAEYQTNTDRRLQVLIEIVEEVRKGKSRPKK